MLKYLSKWSVCLMKDSQKYAWDLNTWEHLCVEVGGTEVLLYFRNPQNSIHICFFWAPSLLTTSTGSSELASFLCFCRTITVLEQSILLCCVRDAAFSWPQDITRLLPGLHDMYIQLYPTPRVDGVCLLALFVAPLAAQSPLSIIISGTLVKTGVLWGL